MARPFDPRKVLKQIANHLLREFFTRRGELAEVPWNDLPEHRIEPIFTAWEALPQRRNIEVQVILRDIHELADHRGRAVLAEEVRQRCPERAEEFRAMASNADSAMWVYLHAPDAFLEAAMFSRADTLAAGRYWYRRNGLPRKRITVDRAMREELAAELTSFYGTTQMRGRYCQIVHYHRPGGSDYFFAYLDDYPDKRLVFADDAEHPTVRSDRHAFEIVFVYTAGDGSMELFARGGRKVWEPLQLAFCRAVLAEEVAPMDPLRPSFQLHHLLAPGFPLVTDPNDRIEEARITRLRLAPQGTGGHIEIKADPKGHRNDIYEKINQWVEAEYRAMDATRVLQASFNIRFQHDGVGRAPTLTFDVSAPYFSNLKSKPDEQREVGERCLKLWKVVSDEAR